MEPGPAFKMILDEAFEAQLDGSFSDEHGAHEWLNRRLGTSTAG
jgi:tRNA nucleotidyltransferase (CCA-adding enzyme)